MTDMASTLDLTSGMTVTHVGTSGLLRVSEVREPSHPLMPGLVVIGHYWRADERRYNDREAKINVIEITRPEWHVWTDDMLPVLPDERYDVPDDDMAAWRYGAEITIRQFRPWDTTTWPGARSNTDTLARSYDSTARVVSSSAFGVPSREIRERRYKITSNVTVPDPDDPNESMPIYDGPADRMAERLIPGTYTDMDGREWTVTDH